MNEANGGDEDPELTTSITSMHQVAREAIQQDDAVVNSTASAPAAEATGGATSVEASDIKPAVANSGNITKTAEDEKVEAAKIDAKLDKTAAEMAKALEEKKKMTDELDKIKENLAKSRTALTSEEKQVESISSLLKNEEDPEAKAKLMSAKDSATKKVADLRSHIVLGEKLVATKESRIKEISVKHDSQLPIIKSKASDILLDKKLAKEEEDKAKEAALAAAGASEESDKLAVTAVLKTKEQLLSEDKLAKKMVEESLMASNLAQRSIDKLKPMITAENAQIKRLESLIMGAKSGSDKEKSL